jgi:glycosyltransferase involved in cell wall biosynthesis
MKILFLNYEYPPLGGGAANATKHLLLEYSKRADMEVDLVTSATDGQTRTEYLSDQVRIHFVSIGNKKNNLHHQSVLDLLLYSVRGYQKSRELLKAGQYDVTHAFFGVPCGAIALLLKFSFGVPYIVSLRGSDVPGYSQRFRFLYPFLRTLIRQIWLRAQAVVANSSGLAELAMVTAPKQKIVTIPNGVDTEHFYPDVSHRPEEETIITVGATRITARKGIRFLIEAIYMLHEQFPALSAEIMGDGSAKEELIGLTKEYGLTEHIRFLGRVDASLTSTWYKRASIFVLPSQNEGMSNALLEALASGLPAIVTDTGGSYELVTEGENGLYIEKNSAESIKEALKNLLSDEVKREAMGAESRKRAESLSWSRVAEQYTSLYKECL